MKIMLSIIYVYYNTPLEIYESIKSIPRAAGQVPYEIIVVNNTSTKPLPESLKNHAKITVIDNTKNYGYGKALNIGSRRVQGELLLFVNSDTLFYNKAIERMVEKIKHDKSVGFIGPQIVDKDSKVSQSISNTPFLPKALVVFSPLRMIWPFTNIDKKFHRYDENRSKELSVEAVGGMCMLTRKSVFDKVGGFDERFFMYFEEADICYRVRKLGYSIIYFPKARVMHLLGRSSQDTEWIRKTFEQSRFNFFRKYHGIFYAIVSEFILRIFSHASLPLICILLLSAFFNFYNLNTLMQFIGDQGWFYLAARDMLLTGNVPLVGIPSSHPWLHQGPLWTYMLAIVLRIGNFNPVSGAYLTASIGVVTVFMIYKVGSQLFSPRVGLIAAGLYATSPLAIVLSRMPYHTSPIPLFTLLFIYSLYKWIKGNNIFFAASLFFLAILYNLELATIPLAIIILLFLLYGASKKTKWFYGVANKNIIALSILAFVLPMLPVLVYDLSHGFRQTLGFAVWIAYATAKPVLFALGIVTKSSMQDPTFFSFVYDNIQRLIFLPSSTLAIVLVFSSLSLFFWKIIQMYKKKEYKVQYIVLLFCFLVPVIGFIIVRTPSDAYLPVFFPTIILILALFFDQRIKKTSLVAFAIVIIVLLNVYVLLFNDFTFSSGKKITFLNRIEAAKTIVRITNNQQYNLVGRGWLNEFPSYIMNYEYLAWWFGNAPTKEDSLLKIYITEQKDKILVERGSSYK